MRATFSPEQRTLAETAEDLAGSGRDAARTLLDGGDLPAEPTRSLFAGFGGLAVPEDLGGDGGDLVDLAIVLERLGRQVTPTPWVAHVLAVQAVLGAIEPDAAREPLGESLRGQRRWTLAVTEGTETGWGPWQAELTDGHVTGSKRSVPDAADADLVATTVAGGALVLTAPSGVEPRSAADRTRPLADVDLDGPALASGGDATAGLRRAAAALSAELAGVGRGAIDLAVAYAGQREQFGQPIGKFQGVAHQLADAFTSVQAAWSLALYACWAVDADAPDAVRSVHAAKARASDAAVFAAERATQTHGGIGITWEADPHLYLRRALADAVQLGTAAWHRQQLASAVLS